MEKQLEFFKEKIIQTLSEVRNDIGETRYSLYVQMVLQCNDYDELKEMAELEMQLDSIAYTKQSIKDKLTKQSVDIKDLRKVCYPPYNTSDEQVLETGELDEMIDDPNTLSLMALQLQKRLEETPPEELQRPQEFDADDFLTEDERLNNLAIQFDRESIEEALAAGIPIEGESEDEDEEEQDNDTFDTSDFEDWEDDDEESDDADTFDTSDLEGWEDEEESDEDEDEESDDEDEESDDEDEESDDEDDEQDRDTFDTSDLDEFFEDDEEAESESKDTFDTSELFEDAEEAESGSEDTDNNTSDTFDTSDLFEDDEEAEESDEDEESDEGEDEGDSFNTDGLFEDEDDTESESEDEDIDTFNTDDLDDMFGDEDEESDEDGEDTFSTDGLGDMFGDEDEEDTQPTQNTQSTNEQTLSQYDENGRKLTFIRGPHAKSTQKTFDSMSKVQNVLGKFGKNIINNS